MKFAIPRSQESLALSAFGLLTAIVIVAGLASSANISALREVLDSKQRTLDELQQSQIADGLPVAVTRAKYPVIVAQSKSLAASVMQKEILSLITAAGISLQSIQVEPASEADSSGDRRLNAQFTCESSLESLQRLLFWIETDQPFIFIDSLQMQPVSTAGGAVRPGNVLRIALVASSYWKEPSTVAPPPNPAN